MSVVVLTGGIGTGKSTVLDRFRALGADTANGDQIAREVLARPEVSARVASALGLSLPLDRQAVADVVFNDPHALQTLESITHPRIRSAFERLRDAQPRNRVLVYEYPLLPDPNDFDAVITVTAPRELRMARLTSRGMQVNDVVRRMRAQASDEEYRAVADHVIENAGDTLALEQAVGRVWKDLQRDASRL